MSAVATAPEVARGSRRGASAFLASREFPVALALVVVVGGTALANHNFLSTQGRTDLLIAVSITALMAIGQTFVVVMRNVDLSVGSVLGLSAYIAGSAVRGARGGLLLAIGVGLAAGLAAGGVNRFLGIPWLMLVALGATAVPAWFLRSRRTGRDLYAVGSYPPAAEIVG